MNNDLHIFLLAIHFVCMKTCNHLHLIELEIYVISAFFCISVLKETATCDITCHQTEEDMDFLRMPRHFKDRFMFKLVNLHHILQHCIILFTLILGGD